MKDSFYNNGKHYRKLSEIFTKDFSSDRHKLWLWVFLIQRGFLTDGRYFDVGMGEVKVMAFLYKMIGSSSDCQECIGDEIMGVYRGCVPKTGYSSLNNVGVKFLEWFYRELSKDVGYEVTSFLDCGRFSTKEKVVALLDVINKIVIDKNVYINQCVYKFKNRENGLRILLWFKEDEEERCEYGRKWLVRNGYANFVNQQPYSMNYDSMVNIFTIRPELKASLDAIVKKIANAWAAKVSRANRSKIQCNIAISDVVLKKIEAMSNHFGLSKSELMTMLVLLVPNSKKEWSNYFGIDQKSILQEKAMKKISDNMSNGIDEN